MTKKDALLESQMTGEDILGVVTELQMLLAVEFPVTENHELTQICKQLNCNLNKFVEKLCAVGHMTQTKINFLGEFEKETP